MQPWHKGTALAVLGHSSLAFFSKEVTLVDK